MKKKIIFGVLALGLSSDLFGSCYEPKKQCGLANFINPFAPTTESSVKRVNHKVQQCRADYQRDYRRYENCLLREKLDNVENAINQYGWQY